MTGQPNTRMSLAVDRVTGLARVAGPAVRKCGWAKPVPGLPQAIPHVSLSLSNVDIGKEPAEVCQTMRPGLLKCCGPAVLSLLLLLSACGDEGAMKPHSPQPALVVFLGWDCCDLACLPDSGDWGPTGRVQNVGDSTAYNILVVTQPCSTCNTSGSIQVIGSLGPMEIRGIRGIRGWPPGSCPWIRPLRWSRTPPDSSAIRDGGEHGPSE